MEQQNEEISPSFYCPLTMELMEDPVIDPDGHSYERKAIAAWVSKNPVSPITRNPLTLAELRPNRALKESIDKVRHRAPQSRPSNIAPASSISPEVQTNPQDEDVEVKITRGGKNLLVSLVPPAGRTRAPLDVVCVIDVSGSMGSDATLKTAAGESENFGFCVLDIIKHAMKTIMATLTARDRLALVTFSHKATVHMELTAMNDMGRKSADRVVDAMSPSGSTNLWAGLFEGLEILRKTPGECRHRAVLLLTDGEPNIIPPRGHLPMLDQYRSKHSELPGVIYTFGFGYHLDSQLLVDLAVGGHGVYSFIPDSSLVGTVFIHTLSALLTSMASHVTLTFHPNGAKIDTSLGGHPVTLNDDGSKSISFGALLYEQSKDFVFPLEDESGSASLEVTLKWRGVLSGEDKVKTLKVTLSNLQTDAKAVDTNYFRLQFVDMITRAMEPARKNNLKEAREMVKALSTEITASEFGNEELMNGLMKDLQGQVSEAFASPEWFFKWGVHYLPSLKLAHLNQHCNNFKDPGVQHYGGKLFNEVRDEIDATFLTLPPPTPSNRFDDYGGSSSRSSSNSNRASTLNMGYYHSNSNPCFAGSSMVAMADGTRKPVSEIKKGDLVLTPNNNSKVRCVVKTVMRSGKASLVELPSGLVVTPYHPIRIKGEWVFPRDVADPKEISCDAVYSFLLDESTHEPVMIINDTECVALAHGIFSSSVISHHFFGTHRVIDALRPMTGFEDGLVQLADGCLVRDDVSGLVIGLLQESS